MGRLARHNEECCGLGVEVRGKGTVDRGESLEGQGSDNAGVEGDQGEREQGQGMERREGPGGEGGGGGMGEEGEMSPLLTMVAV